MVIPYISYKLHSFTSQPTIQQLEKKRIKKKNNKMGIHPVLAIIHLSMRFECLDWTPVKKSMLFNASKYTDTYKNSVFC